MGQWWRVVNLDKREWFDTRVIGVKTLQHMAFPDDRLTPGGILMYLLRDSNRSGGGDLGVPMLTMEGGKGLSDEEEMRLLAAKAKSFENVPLSSLQVSVVYAGRWHGDRITLIGDYDTSGLYEAVDKLPRWTELDYEALADEFSTLIIGPLLAGERAMAEAQAMLAERGKTKPDKFKTIVTDGTGAFTVLTHEDDGTTVERFEKPA